MWSIYRLDQVPTGEPLMTTVAGFNGPNAQLSVRAVVKKKQIKCTIIQSVKVNRPESAASTPHNVHASTV